MDERARVSVGYHGIVRCVEDQDWAGHSLVRAQSQSSSYIMSDDLPESISMAMDPSGQHYRLT